jgi:hypothetical protein
MSTIPLKASKQLIYLVYDQDNKKLDFIVDIARYKKKEKKIKIVLDLSKEINNECIHISNFNYVDENEENSDGKDMIEEIPESDNECYDDNTKNLQINHNIISSQQINKPNIYIFDGKKYVARSFIIMKVSNKSIIDRSLTAYYKKYNNEDAGHIIKGAKLLELKENGDADKTAKFARIYSYKFYKFMLERGTFIN